MLRDDRIDDFLTKACLIQRKVSVNEDLRIELQHEINFQETKVSLERLQTSSLEYLKNAICE